MAVGDDVIEGAVSFFPPDSGESEQCGDVFSPVAMAMGNDVIESSVSFFAPDSVEAKQSVSAISPEDLAWADSCLVKDFEISEGNWDSLKIALLEIQTLQPSSLDFSAAGRDDFPEGIGIEILSSSEEMQTSPERAGDNAVLANEDVEQNGDDYTKYEKIDELKSRRKFGYPFLPHYSEDPKENENDDSVSDMGSPVFASEDIFRVWDLDLDFPDDEGDELIKQLNKALAESSSQPLPLISNDSLADLIAGISDLNLNPNS